MSADRGQNARDLGAGESRYGIPAAAPRLVFALQSAPRSVQPTEGEEQREVYFQLAALLAYFCRRGSPLGSLRNGDPSGDPCRKAKIGEPLIENDRTSGPTLITQSAVSAGCRILPLRA
jgi:hypothetical protein